MSWTSLSLYGQLEYCKQVKQTKTKKEIENMRFLIKLNNKISLLKPSTSSSSSGHSCYKQPFDYLCFSEESELVHTRVHLLETLICRLLQL